MGRQRLLRRLARRVLDGGQPSAVVAGPRGGLTSPGPLVDRRLVPALSDDHPQLLRAAAPLDAEGEHAKRSAQAALQLQQLEHRLRRDPRPLLALYAGHIPQ